MKKGFTLIELLVVVLIIGILSAVAVPQYQRSVEKSRAAEALVLGRSIVAAQQSFYMANGEYTTNHEDLVISLPCQELIQQVNENDTCRLNLHSIYLPPYDHVQVLLRNSLYWFDFKYDGKQVECVHPIGSKYSWICPSLGGKNGYEKSGNMRYVL